VIELEIGVSIVILLLVFSRKTYSDAIPECIKAEGEGVRDSRSIVLWRRLCEEVLAHRQKEDRGESSVNDVFVHLPSTVDAGVVGSDQVGKLDDALSSHFVSRGHNFSRHSKVWARRKNENFTCLIDGANPLGSDIHIPQSTEISAAHSHRVGKYVTDLIKA
jgi:hypothetical protein